MPRKKRWLHVPRRVLRKLASGCSRSETAVLLGSVIRCIFFHRAEGRHRVDGRLPARWGAEAFGVSERAVIGARQRLTAMGWLKSLESPGWSVARFGKRVMLALGSAGGWVQPVVGSAWARRTRHFLRKIKQELARRRKGTEKDEGPGLQVKGIGMAAHESGLQPRWLFVNQVQKQRMRWKSDGDSARSGPSGMGRRTINFPSRCARCRAEPSFDRSTLPADRRSGSS